MCPDYERVPRLKRVGEYMASPIQVEPTDLDSLAAFIKDSGEPQPLEELTLRFIELARQRALTELNTI
jgi:hypothetical protein